VIAQQQRTRAHVHGCGRRCGGLRPHQSLEDGDDGVQARERVRFDDAERGEPERGEVLLQVADVVLTYPEVMQQVAGAVPVARLDCVDLRGVGCLERQRRGPQGAQ
jgi:hypothetical protein